MPRVTTRPVSGGAVAVFCGRCRVGYVSPRGDGGYLWEFCLRSEVLNAAPHGAADSRRAALERIVQCARGWLVAAELRVVEHDDPFDIEEGPT